MPATDAILIEELEIWCRVGVTEAERARRQRLQVCVEIPRSLAAASAADDLTLTIDYFAVTQRLLHIGDCRSWNLIETLASDIAGLILEDFGARQVRVEVRKFIIPEARYVAVRINRAKRAKRLKTPPAPGHSEI